MRKKKTLSAMKSQRKKFNSSSLIPKDWKICSLYKEMPFLQFYEPSQTSISVFLSFHFFFPSSSFLSEPEFKASNAMSDSLSFQFYWTHSLSYITISFCFLSSHIFRKLNFGSFCVGKFLTLCMLFYMIPFP